MITQRVIDDVRAVSEQRQLEEELIEHFEFDMNCYGLTHLVEQFRNDGTLTSKAREWSENNWIKSCVEKAYTSGLTTGYQRGLNSNPT